MNKKQLEKFKELLKDQRTTIKEELDTLGNKGRGDPNSKFPKFDEDSSMEEAADEVEEFINLLPVKQGLETRLKEIDAALDRIKKGTYGKCSNCKGQNVPIKRLEVLPETDICLKCDK